MNESSIYKLQAVLSNLQSEADSMAYKLEEYHKEISKVKQAIEKSRESFSEDAFVFSPRSDRGQSEELNQLEKQLEQLEKDCVIFQGRYDQLSQDIDSIVEVLTSGNDKKSGNISGLLYQEQDRQRIARDLHDTALKNMGYLISKLEFCSQYIESDPIKAKMEISIAKQNLRDSIDEIRSIIYGLRPMIIDSSCFQSVIMKLINRINENNEYLFETYIEDIMCNNQLVLISIYRIIEECLLNIKQHAQAYHINVIVQEQVGHYYIYVEDDGKGFDVSKVEVTDELHFGLQIMKERISLLGGTISIDSATNAGTKIKILIPVA